MSRPRLTAALERANDIGVPMRTSASPAMRTDRSPEAAARQGVAPPRPDRPVPIGARRRCWERPRSPRACCGFGDRCVCAPLSPLPGVAPSQRSLREGTCSDEVRYPGHHRGRRRRRWCAGAQGAVPGHRRQPGARPDRLPRSGSARRRPGMVLRVASGRRRARRLVHALGLAGLVPAARDAPAPGQAAQVARLAE